MASQDKIVSFVKKVHRRLISEHLFGVIQTAVCIGLIMVAVIYLSSRLFVFPYFTLWGLIAGIVGFGIVFCAGIFTKPSYASSLFKFDQYFPENLLLTALHALEDESGLLKDLREKTANIVTPAFDLFNRRKKKLWRVRSLIGIGISFGLLLILIIFPSMTQLQAKDIEIEKELIKQIKTEVAKTIKKTAPETLKKELQLLENDLINTETTEEALRELIKKQKELQLREQKLSEKQQASKQQRNAQNGLSIAEKEQLTALKKATKELSEQVGNTQTTLSKLGETTGNTGEMASNQTSPADTSESNGETGSQGTSQGQPSESQSPTGQGSGQGQGEGQGEGQSEGQGQGSGSGTGSREGNGSGAGTGSGSRDLLSVPSRIGGAGQSTVDSGKIGEGTAVLEEEVAVPLSKGSVKPYSQVIGSYKDSYLKSSDRLQLPPDLQRIVQDYFSSLETSE